MEQPLSADDGFIEVTITDLTVAAAQQAPSVAIAKRCRAAAYAVSTVEPLSAATATVCGQRYADPFSMPFPTAGEATVEVAERMDVSAALLACEEDSAAVVSHLLPKQRGAMVPSPADTSSDEGSDDGESEDECVRSAGAEGKNRKDFIATPTRAIQGVIVCTAKPPRRLAAASDREDGLAAADSEGGDDEGFVDFDDLLVGGAEGLREEQEERLPALLAAMGRSVDAILASVGFVEDEDAYLGVDVDALLLAAEAKANNGADVCTPTATSADLPLPTSAAGAAVLADDPPRSSGGSDSDADTDEYDEHYDYGDDANDEDDKVGIAALAAERLALVAQLSAKERALYANAFDSDEEEFEEDEEDEGTTEEPAVSSDDIFNPSEFVAFKGMRGPPATGGSSTVGSAASKGANTDAAGTREAAAEYPSVAADGALSPQPQCIAASAQREEKAMLDRVCAALVGEEGDEMEGAEEIDTRGGIIVTPSPRSSPKRGVAPAASATAVGAGGASLSRHPRGFASLMAAVDDLSVRDGGEGLSAAEALDTDRFPAHVSAATREGCHDALLAIMAKYGGAASTGASRK